MRIVFLGSPQFALPTLRRLVESEHEVVAVFTQPDRPVGRGRKTSPPPVKTLALERGIDVRQPRSISKSEVVAELRRLAPDLAVIAAYGQILKQPVLDVPPLGVLNVHASLLPRWRGAAPVPAAILAGDAETGATIMQVRLALDAGPLLASARLPIAPADTTGTLTERIAQAGADLLIDVLPRYAAGRLTPVEQDEALATYAPRIEKADARLDWARDDAATVARKVRAYNPWPVACSTIDGEPLRILECIPITHPFDDEPGTIFAFGGVGEPPLFGAGFGVVAREGQVAVIAVQAPGGRAMMAAAYLNGHASIIGKRFDAAVGGERP
ncbi:MAG: methionyl-tRNA formyltransferase [Dehalococcoidia bacterium]|nr:methionyl-tRNA formyltransferase [Dehalococcoidia bacterium]